MSMEISPDEAQASFLYNDAIKSVNSYQLRIIMGNYFDSEVIRS